MGSREEGADGLSDMDWLVATMGVDGWLRWLVASKGGVDGRRRWMASMVGVYHLGQNNYSFDALQAYCFGINIKL